MRPAVLLNIALLPVISLLHAASGAETVEAPPARLLGFTDAHAAAQVALEKKFDAQIAAGDQKAWLEQMAAAPNHVGSPHDKGVQDK